MWYTGVVEINAATFNIHDVHANTYWEYDEEERSPLSVSESRSRQFYEEGLIDVSPDFNKKLNNYISGESIIGLDVHFDDEELVSSEGTDFKVCLYPGELNMKLDSSSFMFRRYTVENEAHLEIDFKRPNWEKDAYFQRRSLKYKADIEVNGVFSERFLDYKLKEIYLYYALDVIRNDMSAHKNFLEREFLDSMNIMFVTDGKILAKENFLEIPPMAVKQVDWIRNSEAADIYRKDEPYVGVLIATTQN